MLPNFSRPLGMDPNERFSLCDQHWRMQLIFTEGLTNGTRPEVLNRLAIGIARLDAELRTN